jgi:hypothetical protein
MTQSESEFDGILLPIAKRVFAKTISSEIGGFATKEEIDEVKSRVIQENRDGKLGSILDDKPFIETKLEDDLEYKELMKRGVKPLSMPTGQLFYLDFQYGTSSN